MWTLDLTLPNNTKITVKKIKVYYFYPFCVCFWCYCRLNQTSHGYYMHALCGHLNVINPKSHREWYY